MNLFSNIVLTLFIYSHFLFSQILAEFSTVVPFSSHIASFTKFVSYYAHYTPKDSQSDNIIHFKDPINPHTIIVNVYDSEDLSNIIQTFRFNSKGEYSLNSSPTGEYYFKFNCDYCYNSMTQLPFNIYNYGNYIKNLKKNEDVVLEGYNTTSFLFFQYERDSLETFTIAISKRNHQYLIYYEVLNLNSNKVQFNSSNDNDIALYIDEFITDNNNYLIIIHADVDEIPEKNKLKIIPHPFNITSLEKGKKRTQEIAEYSKLYFKYDLTDYSERQDNIGMFGFDYYNNTEVVYSAPDVLCSIVAVDEDSDYKLLKGFVNSANCSLLTFKRR